MAGDKSLEKVAGAFRVVVALVERKGSSFSDPGRPAIRYQTKTPEEELIAVHLHARALQKATPFIATSFALEDAKGNKDALSLQKEAMVDASIRGNAMRLVFVLPNKSSRLRYFYVNDLKFDIAIFEPDNP
jgi:hypothetical protein